MWSHSGENGGKKLFVIFGQGEKAGVFDFDGAKAPVLAQSLAATNELFTCAADVAGGLVVFSQPADGKFSTRYQIFKANGTAYTPGPFGGLASLADNDNITIPDIHARIDGQNDRDQRKRDEALHERPSRARG